jgi:hypothetical protein
MRGLNRDPTASLLPFVCRVSCPAVFFSVSRNERVFELGYVGTSWALTLRVFSFMLIGASISNGTFFDCRLATVDPAWGLPTTGTCAFAAVAESPTHAHDPLRLQTHGAPCTYTGYGPGRRGKLPVDRAARRDEELWMRSAPPLADRLPGSPSQRPDRLDGPGQRSQQRRPGSSAEVNGVCQFQDVRGRSLFFTFPLSAPEGNTQMRELGMRSGITCIGADPPRFFFRIWILCLLFQSLLKSMAPGKTIAPGFTFKV